MWISIPRDNDPKSSLLFSKSKIMHSDLLRPWNAHFFRTHYTARVRRRQCARAFFPSFYDRYSPVLYRCIRTVWVMSFTSLPSIPLLRQQGANGARYEYDIHIGFLRFVLSCLVDPSMIKSYNITTISLGVVYFFMNMQVSYGLCIVKKT
jgi:hypothetical protein